MVFAGFGKLREASRALLEPFWRPLGASGRLLGASWAVQSGLGWLLCGSWVLLGLRKWLLGVSWVALGPVLGPLVGAREGWFHNIMLF